MLGWTKCALNNSQPFFPLLSSPISLTPEQLLSAETRKFLRINLENLEFKESRDDPWVLLLDLTLPFPLLSVLCEVLLPVQCSHSFHSEAGALCECQILLPASQ